MFGIKTYLKSALKRYVRSKTSGPIFVLRKIRYRFIRWTRKCLFKIYSIKGKKNKVVATSFSGRIYGDNPMYIFEKIHDKSPNTEFVWLKSNKGSYDCPDFVRVQKFSKRARKIIKELASASVIIDNNQDYNWLPGQQNVLGIQTWHGGLGMKKIGLDEANQRYKNNNIFKNSFYDFYISNSDHITKVYRNAFDYRGPIWKIGYPIEDEFLIPQGEREYIREKYNIPQDTKILMYGPTFRGKYKWISSLNVNQLVDVLEKRFGGKWVVMVHYHSHMRLQDRVLPNSIDATEENLQKLIKASDAFISDYSSCIFQAAQCNIPCFIFADDFEEYRKDRDTYDSFEDQPFPYAFTNEELMEKVANYDAILWDEKWKSYAKEMGHIATGHAADDIAKICVDFLNGKPKSEIMNEIQFETKF